MATAEAVDPAARNRCMRADARRNRERILAAAREAFAENGAETQMDDVARRAGVGVGTLYRHFPTKDALIGEFMRLKLTGIAERARAKFESDERPWESFADLLREQAETMHADAAHQRMLFMLTPDAVDTAGLAVEDVHSAMGALIQRAKDAGELRTDLVTDDIRALMCGLGSMMAADAMGVMRYDWRRQLEFALEGMRAGRSARAA